MTQNRTLVLGMPGTGKTERLLLVMESALRRGVPPERIGFCTFTKGAADVAKARACEKFGLQPHDFPNVRTLHSLCFRELGLRRRDVLGEEHLSELADITGELNDGRDADPDAPATRMNADTLMTLDGYARATCRTLRQAWDDHGGLLDWWRVLRFSEALRLYKADKGLIDFTDMLSKYLDMGRPIQVDVGIIDEAQDLTLLQWRVAMRAFENAQELWAAGDDDQCQPAGTMVLTPYGYKDIAKLDPKKDHVVAYSRGESELRTWNHFKKSKHVHVGTMHTIKASGLKTECTPNHRWYIKWTHEAKWSKINAVYLMKKGNWFRVGWCQMFREGGVFRVNSRSNEEGADGAWILKTTHDKREAYEYEQIVSAKYGIPMLPFSPARGNKDVTQALINRVYGAVDSAMGGKQALLDHDLLIAHPFVNRLKPNYTRYGNTINEVVACNILQGLMTVPLKDGKKVQWRVVEVTKKKNQRRTVYGLDVEKYHTYVANGIVTHNSVHRWAGAAEDHLLNLGWAQEILPLSHRLPKAVYDFAGEIINKVAKRYAKPARPDKRQGNVDWLSAADEADLSSGNWLLLARTRYQLGALAQLAREQGVFYALKGQRSVSKVNERAVRAYEALRAGKEVEAADCELVLKMLDLKSSDLANRLHGATDFPRVDFKPIWHDALVGMPLDDREYILACMRRGEKLNKPPRISIETMHGAKGLEADNVLLSTDMTPRVQKGYELDPDSEHRVWYVGATRAYENLFPVAAQTAYGFPL